VQGTKFAKADKNQLAGLFKYLEGCLEQIVKDNELGALKQALKVQPSPVCAALLPLSPVSSLWPTGPPSLMTLPCLGFQPVALHQKLATPEGCMVAACSDMRRGRRTSETQ
jgi:hypothetical protein